MMNTFIQVAAHKKRSDTQMKWYTKHYSEAIKYFEVDAKQGLTWEQAESRQKAFGANRLEGKKKPHILVRYLMQFNDFMIIILIAAAAVSLLLSFTHGKADFIDAGIILGIVMLNALLGLVQESKAEKSIEALKKMSAPSAKVMRSGILESVNTEEIVPGDILLLEAGDFVPADCRIVSSMNLKAEEAALTGESVPVDKDASYIASESATLGDRRNMLFSGSSISYGRGTAIVTSIGMGTEVGKIADMLMNDEAPETPLQKKLTQTGKMLGIGAIIICVCIFLLGIVRQQGVFEMFMTSVSLAVAAIPEGLPAIVTIMLAIGVQRMAKRNAVIRKLPAVETLGSATVICSDKTGTLTQNKMTVVETVNVKGLLEGKNADRELILKYSALCNDVNLEGENKEIKLTGDPTEKALVIAALTSGIDKNNAEQKAPRIDEIPFDSARKLMTTIHHSKESGGYISITKGAPDVLIKKCSHYIEGGNTYMLTESRKNELMRMNDEMAGKALRVLAIAVKSYTKLPYKITEDTVENDLSFVGLVGMIDPPREEAAEAVKTCVKAGIKPVMITGDHVVTAKVVASKLGILRGGEGALTGTELNDMTQDELVSCINKYSVFARVSPEHKVRIVKAFQKRGEVVAMTGDGVNDAPALKAADIGCAMGISGTDVAKGAADMVLTDDNFATIVHAVSEGRGIYANIRKAVHFLLSSNIGEILVMLVALLMGWPTPLLAIHLLWTNLVTDSLPAIALGLDPAESDIMDGKTESGSSGLFSNGLWQRIAVEGMMVGMLALVAFAVGSVYYDTAANENIVGRTMAFATLSISQLVHSFNMRTEKSIFTLSITSNIYLVYAFVVGVLLQVGVIMLPFLAETFKVVPLTPVQWLIVAGLCILPIFIVELEKLTSQSTEKKKVNNYQLME